MKDDKQEKLIFCIVIIIPVIWFALLIAPYISEGLVYGLSDILEALNHPFHIQFCKDSFGSINVKEMVLNKGVAGFFARGYYYAPEGAQACLTFTDGKVISYIDRNTTKGTIIVHAGQNILGYHDAVDTKKKISEQALALLKEEVCGGKE